MVPKKVRPGVAESFAMVVAVGGALLLIPSPVTASSINCMVNSRTSDQAGEASLFVRTLCGGPTGVATWEDTGESASNSLGEAGGADRSPHTGAGSPQVSGSSGHSLAGSAGIRASSPSDRRDGSATSAAAGAPAGSASGVWTSPEADLGPTLITGSWQRLRSDPLGLDVIPVDRVFPPVTGPDRSTRPGGYVDPVAATDSWEPGRLAVAVDSTAVEAAGDVSALAVPEPGTLVLLGIGSAMLWAMRRTVSGRSR